MKHYYEKPTMVKFLDPYYELMVGETERDRPWLAGIAFGEYVSYRISLVVFLE